MNTKQTSADMRVDSMIRLALLEIAEEKWQEIEALDTSDVVISERHDKRMRRLFQRGASASQRKKTAKRIVLSVLVALAVFAMLGMAIPPVRQAVVKTIITWYDTRFGVRYEVETDEPLPTVIEEVILPAWLPDGWTLETKHSGIDFVIHILSNGDGNSIRLQQCVLDPDDETAWFDNTDVTVETVLLNGATEARLFSYEDERRTLTWTDRYVFILSGSADEGGDSDVLIRIAESMG